MTHFISIFSLTILTTFTISFDLFPSPISCLLDLTVIKVPLLAVPILKVKKIKVKEKVDFLLILLLVIVFTNCKVEVHNECLTHQ